MDKMIASAEFKVNGKTDWATFENVKVRLELHPSEMFDYGNGTMMLMISNDKITSQFDTRYERDLKRDGSNFSEWGLQFMKDWVAKELTVELA